MKNNYINILLIIGLFVVIGCRGIGNGTLPIIKDGKLTTEKAQNTLSRWVKDGQVTVRGIQESGNTAQADVNFSNFHFTLKSGEESTYSGPGTAVFTHYNDGRWVLKKVSTSEGFNSIWWDDINVEAY
jgi:hypothetical protein